MMNEYITTGLALLALFFILGKCADLAIYHSRMIAEKLGIGIFFLGLIMGFFTSFPELAVGVSALIDDVPNISLGNLFGGIVVLFSLVLGINVILQRKLKADHSIFQLSIILLFLLVPVILGLNGSIGIIEGAAIIVAYFAMLFVLYRQQRHIIDVPHLSDRKSLFKHMFLFLLGVVLVLVVANFTVDLTAGLLDRLPLSRFVVGLIIFAIGTNFPEIIVAIRAWRNNLKELSLSNLFGSAMANTLLIGVFAVIRPFSLVIDNSYYVLLACMLGLFVLLLIFYRTGRSLRRAEGVALLLVYIIFILLQIFFEESV